MNKLNLHTHSEASWDATITIDELAEAFEAGEIDQIAITDHDEIKFAQNALQTFGHERVIVGEEMTTAGGSHLIGLFLTKYVPRGLSVVRTAELIRAQGGLVYVPHPYAHKWGLGEEQMSELLKLRLLDIVEGFNAWEYKHIVNLHGRKSHNTEATNFAVKHSLPIASASDAHSIDSIARAYTEVSATATKQNLVELLKSAKSHKREYNQVRVGSLKAGSKVMKAVLTRSRK